MLKDDSVFKMFTYGSNQMGSQQTICLFISKNLEQTVGICVTFGSAVGAQWELAYLVSDTLQLRNLMIWGIKSSTIHNQYPRFQIKRGIQLQCDHRDSLIITGERTMTTCLSTPFHHLNWGIYGFGHHWNMKGSGFDTTCGDTSFIANISYMRLL